MKHSGLAPLPEPPDYTGNSLVNLMTTVGVGRGGRASTYPPLALSTPDPAGYRHVVVIVVDGLGDAMLLHHAGAAPTFSAHRIGVLDSVFPSTTASAITTFLTGLAPQQHALTGWHVYTPEIGCVTAVLPYRARDGQKLLRRGASALYDQRPFSDGLTAKTYMVAPGWLMNTRYNLAYAGRSEQRAYVNLADFFPKLAHTLKNATHASTYTYAYYPEVDHLAHEFGSQSPEVGAHLALIDRQFDEFLTRIRGTDTLVLLTADHGFVDTSPGSRIDLDAHPALAALLRQPLCGESRAAYCYVKEGKHDEFRTYVQEALAEVADVVESRQLLAGGYYGHGEPHPHLLDRIGDYVLMMRDNYVIKDWLPGEERYTHVGVHGGMTCGERKVPLLAATA